MLLPAHCAACDRLVYLPVKTLRRQSREYANRNYCGVCEPELVKEETQ